MSLYTVALFVHIVGALLLFVLLTVEGVSLRLGFAAAAAGQILGPISALAILIPGLYMMSTQWGWAAWVVVGITSWVLIAAGGAFTGVSVMRRRMSTRAAAISWLLRVGIALGVVFDMTVKPEIVGSIAAVLAGALLGLAASRVAPRAVRSA
jgi:hypothetical protein